MKKLIDSMLCAAIFAMCCTGSLSAQTSEGGENYYSNPKKGIKSQPPMRYVDSSIVEKSDDLIVELTGENMVPDTSVADSSKGFNPDYYYDYAYTARINRFHRGMNWGYYDNFYTDLYWYTGIPYYWGASIYYGWSPWLYSWGWGPYLPYYSMFYYDFWYDPWYSPWYAGMWYYPCHYYGYGSAWYGGYVSNSYVGPYGYLGSTGRGAYYPTTRNSGGKMLNDRTQPALGGGTVRRGGVDISGGGRGTMGHVSGVQSSGRGANGGRTVTASTGSNTARSGMYDKPASVAQNREAQTRTSARTSNGAQQTYGNSGRGASSYSTTSRGGSNNTGYRQTSNSRSNSLDSYRNTSTHNSGSTYSSGRSGSTYSSGSSSSRSSSGGGFSGGGSSRSSGGGGGHSSSRR